MPPALVLLGLVSVGVPGALRAALGRPRFLVAAILASAVVSLAAQLVGEVLGLTVGVVGDAQVGLAAVASVAACGVVSVVEGGRRSRVSSAH